MIKQHHKLSYLRKDLSRSGYPWLSELRDAKDDQLIAIPASLAAWISDTRSDLLSKERVKILVLGTSIDTMDKGGMWSLLPKMLGKSTEWAEIIVATSVGDGEAMKVGLVPPAAAAQVTYLGAQGLDRICQMPLRGFDIVFVSMSDGTVINMLLSQDFNLWPMLNDGATLVLPTLNETYASLHEDAGGLYGLGSERYTHRFYQPTNTWSDPEPQLCMPILVSIKQEKVLDSESLAEANRLTDLLMERTETIVEIRSEMQAEMNDPAEYRHWGMESTCLSSSSAEDTFITLPKSFAVRRIARRICRMDGDRVSNDTLKFALTESSMDQYPGSDAHWIERMSWACDLWDSGLGEYYSKTLEAVMGQGTGAQIKKVDMEAMADRIGSAANLSEAKSQALRSLMGGTRHTPSKDERVLLAEISKRDENRVIEILHEQQGLTRTRNENNEPLALCLLTEGMFMAFYALIELDPGLLAGDPMQRPVIVDAASGSPRFQCNK